VACRQPVADLGFVGDDGLHPHDAISAADVAERLGSDPARGLSAHDAAARLVEHGPNELDGGDGVSRAHPARPADVADDPPARCRGSAVRGRWATSLEKHAGDVAVDAPWAERTSTATRARASPLGAARCW
jgi:hypothetical protein